MAKRQTIWLSTMMVLSLMLIGFYTVNNNVQQVSTTADKSAAKTTGAKTAATGKNDQAAMEASDYFIAKHIADQQDQSKLHEKLEAIIADPKSTADQVEQAKNQMKTMDAQQEQIDKVVDQINAEGFPDVLVNTTDSGKVNVTVQAQTLDNKKAVQIMSIVSKEMKVSAAKITVFNHE